MEDGPGRQTVYHRLPGVVRVLVSTQVNSAIMKHSPVEAANAGRKESPPGVAGWRWGVVWLMFLATLINYMDRQTLGSAARYIKDEFRLTEEAYGWVEFWFIISYALFGFPPATWPTGSTCAGSTLRPC